MQHKICLTLLICLFLLPAYSQQEHVKPRTFGYNRLQVEYKTDEEIPDTAFTSRLSLFLDSASRNKNVRFVFMVVHSCKEEMMRDSLISYNRYKYVSTMATAKYKLRNEMLLFQMPDDRSDCPVIPCMEIFVEMRKEQN